MRNVDVYQMFVVELAKVVRVVPDLMAPVYTGAIMVHVHYLQIPLDLRLVICFTAPFWVYGSLSNLVSPYTCKLTAYK